MRIYREIELRDFGAWSGAESTMETLEKLNHKVTFDVFDVLENCMDDCNTEWDETSVNDFLWFENDTIAEWLGYKDWEYLEKDANDEPIELHYSIGEHVTISKRDGIHDGEIIDTDDMDMDLPYLVSYIDDDGNETTEWCGEDEFI